MLGVGRQQVHGIYGHRLVHREVVEAGSNYKRSYLWRFRNPACGDSTGSNRVEKDLVRVPPGHLWAKVEIRCDLVCLECLQIIRPIVVVLMS